ncbi:MAG TPA: methyl-accepting chemotaxis protein [Stellaceae bacterium]|nr:methyl-accepting chemotaxis protein [Stellaceae bacterium]
MLKNWKIGPKLYLVIFAMAVLAGTVGYLGIDAMRTYQKGVEALDRASERALLNERINEFIYATVMESRGIYMSTAVPESEKYAPLLLRDLNELAEIMRRWEALIPEADKETMARAKARVDEFIKFRKELVRLSREATLPEARAFGDNDANHENRKALNAEIAALAQHNDKLIGEIAAATNEFFRGRLITLVIIAVIGVMSGFALAILFVTRVVTGPVAQLTETMTRLASGDTSGRIAARDRGDEIGDMARAVQFFQGQALAAHELTEQVTEDVRRIALAAGQASSAVSQVSDGSNLQLSSLKKTATALNQSTLAIADVAKSTQLASEQARGAAGLASEGLQRMSSMVTLVKHIAEDSNRVRRIAGAIARIASQTNMLSLNAAIEAARAGGEGRGFAVVAEEVRKLADNTASLAQEIADLVNRATEQAGQGVAVADEVSLKVQQIAEGVRESDKLVGAIAAAMEEQQVVVKEINMNVAELSRIGQSNATAAEEITATMVDLSKLAEETRREVEQFKRVTSSEPASSSASARN